MRSYLLLIGLLLFPACSDSAPSEYPCPDSLAPAEAIASTPRVDTDLELLALRLSDGEVADQDIYDRLVADVAALRALEPAVASIGYFEPHDGTTLHLRVSRDTLDAMANGDYTAWNCLNEHYGLIDIEHYYLDALNTFLAEVQLKGIYDLVRVAEHYAELPEIEAAEPNRIGGDGSTICVTPEGDTWHMVFDSASGDCPLGCTIHHYYYFTTQADGTRAFAGEWDSELGEPAPEWASYLDACR